MHSLSFPPTYAPTSRRVILTPGPFARKHLLYLQEVGQYRLLKAGHETRRQGLDSYLVVLVQGGAGALTYEGRTWSLSAGQCFFLDCRAPHRYASSIDAPWELAWAHFDGCSAQGYYALFSRRSEPVFTPAEPRRLSRILTELLALGLSPSAENELQNARLLTDLVTLLTAGKAEPAIPPDAYPGGEAVLNQIREHLKACPEEEHSLDGLAARFHISKYHLSHAFKRRYGLSPMEYLAAQRVGRAKQLLRFTDCTIAQIAEACGFNDPGYLARQFKKAEGQSASAYRKRWKG